MVSSLLNKVRLAVPQFIQDHRDNLALRLAGGWSRAYCEAYERASHGVVRGGEKALLDAIREAGLPVRTVFDVGANHGEWATAAREVFPEAALHLFEVAPPTARALAQKFDGVPGVVVNELGLGDQAGEFPLAWFGEHNSELSSLATAREAGRTGTGFQVIQAQVTTGDEYLRTRGLPGIDVLKLDVEGFEHEVLVGLSDALRRGAIPVIQFEFMGGRRLLKDFFDLLVPHGYRIGKVHSRYVEFFGHSWPREQFLGPNYAAVHQSLGQVIATASKPR